MGKVDIADQLRNGYRLMAGARKSKWWWALMQWSFGIILTNAYTIYSWVTGSRNHYRFLNDIALAWLGPGVDSSGKNSKRQRGDPEPDESDSDCERQPKRRRVVSRLITEKLVMSGKLGFRFNNVGSHLPVSAKAAKLNPYDIQCVPCKTWWMFKLPTNMTRDESHKYFASKKYKKLKSQAKRKRGTSVAHCPGCRINICVDCWTRWHTPSAATDTDASDSADYEIPYDI